MNERRNAKVKESKRKENVEEENVENKEDRKAKQ